MERNWITLALAGLGFGFVLTRGARGTSQRHTRALEHGFHAAYGGMRSAAANALPVLVLFGDMLHLTAGGRHTEHLASSPITPIIQAAAHLPVALYATLLDRLGRHEGRLDPLSLGRLQALREAQSEVRQVLDRLDASMVRDVEEVLDRSHIFIARAMSDERVDPADMARFTTELGPLLLRLTEHATGLELEALHTAVEAAVRDLSARERAELEVVVAGAHQARARSLALQYFRRRLGEATGEEQRVAYAEAAANPAEAHALVGTRRLDRDIARAFFGDAKRLQRDVLGDAAARLLEGADLPLIT